MAPLTLFRVRLSLVCIAVMAWTSAAYAQASITGVVKDTSGAVLPGVTAEAASPVLIEKARSVVTDGTGQYRIENLRPGTYVVTFTLPGFNTVKRDGIELSGAFTATVNADMRVGALEETITVTGETPVVDVQSTTRQQVLNAEVMNTIPSGRNASFMSALIPSVVTGNQDVGGVGGESFSSAGGVRVHGVVDVRTQVNGISVHSVQGNGATGVGNMGAYQEMVVDTSGVSAEYTEGGVRMNMIPREGGNTFSGSFFGAFANSSMQSDNLTRELTDRGLRTANSLKRYVDLTPEMGGPVMRDKLWFHITGRYNNALNFAPIFFNRNAGDPNVWIYEPDTSRGPVVNKALWKGANGRITWQATAKNKLAIAYDRVYGCQCPSVTATQSPEGTVGATLLGPKNFVFADWTAPLTSRLLFEAGFAKQRERGYRPYENIYFPRKLSVRLNSVTEQSSGLVYRASGTEALDTWGSTFLPRGAISYITGAHAFKVGFNSSIEWQDQWRYTIDSGMSFRFNNGVPNRLTLQNTPWRRKTDLTRHGLFVQDRWTIERLTLTGGVRYDYFRSSFPAVTIGPGEFVPNRNLALPEADGVRWHDLSPRTGAAYDLFGDGKTAVKVSLNKYLGVQGAPNSGGPFTTNLAPASRLVTATNRSWQDANRNFVPDCDLINPAVNGECGAMDNPDFGTTRPGVAYDPATLSGWGKRDYNWQFSAGVQHELVPRVSLDVSYFRTWFGNFIVTDNRAISPADLDRFSLTAPLDPRLPGGGGYVVSGLYDLKPTAFGRAADNYLTYTDNYGKQIEHWNGVDVTVNARPRPGLRVQGGTSTGRRTADNCEILARIPEINLVGAQDCHVQEAFLTQVKFLAMYTIPRIDVQVTGTLQNRPGPEILANYVATNAVVSPSLGRNLAGGANNVTVNIVPPGTMYGERMNQIDLRLGKIVRFSRVRTTASVDLYNLLNANPVLTLSNAFATWQQPQSVLNPRFAKVVLQVEF